MFRSTGRLSLTIIPSQRSSRRSMTFQIVKLSLRSVFRPRWRWLQVLVRLSSPLYVRGYLFGDLAHLPTPPQNPTMYIALNPWSLPEYLLLHSTVLSHSYPKSNSTSRDDLKPIDWYSVARTLNETLVSVPTNPPYRSAWDCLHRFSIPWLRPSLPPPSPQLQRSVLDSPSTEIYPVEADMQHVYTHPTLQTDMHDLMEMYLILTEVFCSLEPDQQSSECATAALISPATLNEVFQSTPMRTTKIRHPGNSRHCSFFNHALVDRVDDNVLPSQTTQATLPRLTYHLERWATQPNAVYRRGFMPASSTPLSFVTFTDQDKDQLQQTVGKRMESSGGKVAGCQPI